MIDGLWTVIFRSNVDLGSGVVVANNGKLLGGDSGFTYIGGVTNSNGHLSVRVKIEKFLPGAKSVLPGLDSYTLALAGKDSPDEIQFTGSVEGHPQATLTVTAKRRADL